MKEILKAENLVRLYGEKRTISDASILLREKEIVEVVGSSGSGKSTLARILCGIEKPDAGEIYLLGKKISDLPDEKLALIRAEHIGFLQSTPVFIDDLTVAENVALPVMAAGISKTKCIKRAYTLLDSMDIRNIAGIYPASIGAYERCLAGLARAVISSPELIIADDCTYTLTCREADIFMDCIRAVRNTMPATILMFTTETLGFTDRTYQINDGRTREVIS